MLGFWSFILYFFSRYNYIVYLLFNKSSFFLVFIINLQIYLYINIYKHFNILIHKHIMVKTVVITVRKIYLFYHKNSFLLNLIRNIILINKII